MRQKCWKLEPFLGFTMLFGTKKHLERETLRFTFSLTTWPMTLMTWLITYGLPYDHILTDDLTDDLAW